MENQVSHKEKNRRPVGAGRRLAGMAAVGLLSMLALLLVACGGSSQPVAEPTAAAPAAAVTDAPAAATTAPADPMEAATAAPADPMAAATVAPAAPATRPTNNIEPADPSAEPLQVVTDMAVVADFVRQVGGDRVTVNTLTALGADVHSYRTSTQDSVRLAQADLIFSNGSGLSPSVDSVIDQAGGSAVRTVVSDGLEPAELVELPFPEADHDHGHDGDDHAEEMVEVHGRLLIGDGETGSLSVIDLEENTVANNAYDMGSRAGRIYKFGDGRYAIAVSSDANNVHIIDGGIYLEAHDGHFDMVETEFRPVGVDLTGENPVHLVISNGWAAIFYDDSGEVVLINAEELAAQGSSYNPPSFNAGPHHGAAVPLEDNLFAVTPQHPDYAANPEEYRLPISADIRDVEGNILYSSTGVCPQLHGDSSNGHIAMFGCAGGVLALEADHGEFSDTFIPGPAGSPDDFRLTSVFGYEGLDHFFALGSGVGLYLVEPEDGAMEQMIAATDALRPIQVAFSYDGELLIVVMSDGEVRMYDAHDGELMAASSDALTGPIDTGFWGRPHIATAPGHIYITDSGAGEVLALDNHDLEVVAHWDVDGKPTKIAFVGILDKGDHPEAGHDEHDDHGHDHGAGDPHFWQNPRFAVHYVNQIAAALIQVDPDNADYYQANAAAYIAQLEELDAYIAGQLETIPQGNRVMVTFHDAFGYFGARYGLEVMAFVGGHGGDVSAEDIASVLELVQDRGLPAIFTEPQFMEDVVRETAREAGAGVGIVYSLPHPDYPDYIGMMRANADTLATNLR